MKGKSKKTVTINDEAKIIKQTGKRIRQLRKAKGYKSHEDFAYDHNFDRTQWGKYERGANMELASLVKVLNALEVTPAQFFSEGFD